MLDERLVIFVLVLILVLDIPSGIEDEDRFAEDEHVGLFKMR